SDNEVLDQVLEPVIEAADADARAKEKNKVEDNNSLDQVLEPVIEAADVDARAKEEKEVSDNEVLDKALKSVREEADIAAKEKAKTEAAAIKAVQKSLDDNALAKKKEDIEELFTKKGLKDGFTINGAAAYLSKHFQVADLRTFIETIENVGVDINISELEGRDISAPRISMIINDKSYRWMNETVKEFGMSIDHLLEPPVRIQTIKVAFTKIRVMHLIKAIKDVIDGNYAYYNLRRSPANSFQIIMEKPGEHLNAGDLNVVGDMRKAGINTAVMREIGVGEKLGYEYSRMRPNVVITKEIKGESGKIHTFTFKIENYVNRTTFEKLPLIYTLVSPNDSLEKNTDFTPEKRKEIYDEVYLESGELFAQDFENARHFKNYGVSGVGAIIYMGEKSGEESGIAKYGWEEFKKRFYDNGRLNDKEGIIEFFNEIKVVRKAGRNMDPKVYGRSIDAQKNAGNLSNPGSAERLFNADRHRGVTEAKISVNGVKEVINALHEDTVLKKGDKNKSEYDKVSNFLNNGKDIRKTIDIRAEELDEDFIRKVYEVGFNGINIIIDRNTDMTRLEGIIAKMPAISKRFGIDVQNYLTVTAGLVSPQLSVIISRLENYGVMLNIKVDGKHVSGSTVKRAVEDAAGQNFSGNIAVELEEISSGEELSLVEKVSVVWLSNTAGIKKAKNEFGKRKQPSAKSFGEIYSDTYRISSEDTDYIASFDVSEAFKETNREKFRTYMSNSISEQEAGNIETAFIAMMKFMEEIGIAKNSFVYKNAEAFSKKPSEDSYAKAKAHFRAAVENTLEMLYLKEDGKHSYETYMKRVSVTDRKAVKALSLDLLLNGQEERNIKDEINYIIKKYTLSDSRGDMTVRDLRNAVNETINEIIADPFAVRSAEKVEKTREALKVLNAATGFAFDRLLSEARNGAVTSLKVAREIMTAA
ncbi:MAG: cell envelope integrity protein TolA, partial [Endomicrobia bacterium]|nr:cell envelope integrity protein TolA [Endomicrobiia bacterium]